NNEVTKISAQINTARQDLDNARAYFNFLLNRPFDSEIAIDTIRNIPSGELRGDTTVSKREELLKLKTAKAINGNLIQLANAAKKPKINSLLDLGSQCFYLKINNKMPYYFLVVSKERNIMSGGKNNYKIKQTEADQKFIDAQTN